MRTFAISLLPSARSNEAEAATLSLADLVDALTNPAHVQQRAEKDGGCWSPIVWRDGTRSGDNALSVCALVFDLDWDARADLGDALTALQARLGELGWKYIIHETYTARRFRLVVPLASDVPRERYQAAYKAAQSELGIEADDRAHLLSQVVYLPSCPEGESREGEAGGENLLDWQTLEIRTVDVTPRAAEKRFSPAENVSEKFSHQAVDLQALKEQASLLPKNASRSDILAMLNFRLVLKKGERENRLHQMACIWATHMKERSWDVIETVFRPCIEMMEGVEDHGVEHYLKKAHWSWARSLERAKREEGHKEAARAYFKGIDEQDWRQSLTWGKDSEGNKTIPLVISSNIDIILAHHPEFKGHLRFNELTRRMEVTGGYLKHYEGSYDVALMQWLERSEFRMFDKGLKSLCGATLLHHSRRFRYNPVQDYLEGLTWDGTPRIDSFLYDYCKAQNPNKSYINSISRKFFISCAARALSPGCKVDTVLVLQGSQGIKKTTLVQSLAHGWYTTASKNVDDKDMRIQMTEAWLVEMSELAAASRSSIETMRGFVTQQSDRIRIPYATYHEDFPRRCVMVGTTNSAQPLLDEEGNRRWWVVSIGAVDLKRVEQDVDQLWAEAVMLFRRWQDHERDLPEAKQQCRWWFTHEEQQMSNEENELYLAENPMELDLHTWMKEYEGKERPPAMSASDIARKVLRLPGDLLHRDPSIMRRVTRALTNMGFETRRLGTRGQRYFAYQMPKEIPEIEVVP